MPEVFVNGLSYELILCYMQVGGFKLPFLVVGGSIVILMLLLMVLVPPTGRQGVQVWHFEYKRTNAVCLMIGLVIMTLCTFIVECVSERVLPWRLFLKLFSNIMFVLIGKTVKQFGCRLAACLKFWYINQVFFVLFSFYIYKPDCSRLLACHPSFQASFLNSE